MKRNRTQSLFVAVIATATLAGCTASAEEEARLAEPVIDFPVTSTTAAPTTESSPTASSSSSSEDAEDEEAEETKSSTTKSSSSKKTSTKTSTSKSTSTRKTSTRKAPREEVKEQVITETIAVDDGSNGCAWPEQGAGSGNQEYSTFCDGAWARTVMPENGQEYFWASKDGGWVSVDPHGTNENGACWAREDFAQAPAAVKNAVPFCN
ncbi:hypothetical protein [Corynebacterium sp. p3-SID1056]|uniref:hypothetical protein n=1 Tax=Corynebacterium sp. p3-SID1056 TaxID=2916092 RepID=UPI0021A3A4D1|nr:hypothetical protein [Corynebacterium sp. p3-SID1056]MCT2339232.1 hypothetical protein [Corynebacterium sp. p3-SID1056]